MLEFSVFADTGAFSDPWQWVVAAWVFAVGASVGSFLNVVIHRLPADMSVAHPASHCPTCKHTIRFYDNVPIASWLLLGGRCRDCGAKFSSRYAWVEFVAGLMLLGVAATGPLTRLRMSREILDDAGAIAGWGQVAYLAVLLAGLWSAALIARDGHRPPWKLIVAPLAVGLGCGLVWPSLYGLPVAATIGEAGYAANLSDTWIGLAGCVVGASAAAMTRIRGPSSAVSASESQACSAATVVAWGAISGLFLGWQMALVAVLLATLLMLFAVVMSARQHRWATRWIGGNWLVYHATATSAVVLTRGAWASLSCEACSQAWQSDWLRWWPLAAGAAIAIAAWATRLAERRDVLHPS